MPDPTFDDLTLPDLSGPQAGESERLLHRLLDALSPPEVSEDDLDAIEALSDPALAALLDHWSLGPFGRDTLAGDLASEAARRLRRGYNPTP